MKLKLGFLISSIPDEPSAKDRRSKNIINVGVMPDSGTEYVGLPYFSSFGIDLVMIQSIQQRTTNLIMESLQTMTALLTLLEIQIQTKMLC